MSVLAAYKPSAEGDAVLAAAIDEARLRTADLLVVRHVKRARGALDVPQASVQASSDQPPLRDEDGQAISKLREEMDALRSRIEGQGVGCETVLIDEGDDHAEAIIRIADRGDVDMIVVGIRRRSRVGKAIMGSEAQRILLNADCPVLAIKAD